MKTLLSCLTVLAVGAALAVGPTTQPKVPALALGRVHKNIACTRDANNHCNIYVPRGYKAGEPTPVLYVFSPGGNAPVELYSPAADKLGWLVCGSVESRNGQDWAFYLGAFDAMRAEMAARFSPHPHRAYFSGMSGGSRVAVELFCREPNSAAGLLAMAAGRGAPRMEKVPGGACVGIAGRSDYNYSELASLGDKCAAQDMASLFLDFDGQHGWAPKELVAQAMEWLDAEYFLRSPHLSEAEKAKRPGIIAERLKKVAQMGQTMEAYEACESLHRDLKADEEPLKKVGDLAAALKPKLAAELDARAAFREAFAAAGKKTTSYQQTVALQAAVKEMAPKHAGTLYGRRAGFLATTLDERLKFYPPELRK